MQEKEFNRISVSDIVREAGITRKTFYNHYQDKIEMVQDYQMKLSKKIQEHIRCHEKIDREFFVDLFLLLGQQDALLTGLFSIHGSPMMQEIIKGTMNWYCAALAYHRKKEFSGRGCRYLRKSPISDYIMKCSCNSNPLSFSA